MNDIYPHQPTLKKQLIYKCMESLGKTKVISNCLKIR